MSEFVLTDAISEQRTSIRIDSTSDLQKVVMENGSIRVTIVPDLGGKLSSLVNLKTNREFLLQPKRPYVRPGYGTDFAAFDISGFDECFPTIAACTYSDEFFGDTALPDHGELWSVPWKHEIRDDELFLAVVGTRLPYVFRKRLRLNQNSLEIRYEVKSVSDIPFRFLWSAHPLLAAESGAEIILPSSINQLFVNSSTSNRLGDYGKLCNWPVTALPDGTSIVLNKLDGPAPQTADKLFTPRLSEGYCGLFLPSTSECLMFRFDPKEIPFAGLWICQGGWPPDRSGEFTVALEPCNGRPDSLAEAIARDECRTLPGLGRKAWELRMELHTGCDRELFTGKAR